MKPILNTFALLAIALVSLTTVKAQDPSTSLGTGPLPPWNDTAPKKAVMAFVEMPDVEPMK